MESKPKIEIETRRENEALEKFTDAIGVTAHTFRSCTRSVSIPQIAAGESRMPTPTAKAEHLPSGASMSNPSPTVLIPQWYRHFSP